MSPSRTRADRIDQLLTFIPFGVAFGLVLVTALVFFDLSELRRATGAVEAEQARLHSLNRLLMVCIDAETGVRGFLLTEDERMLQPYNSALSRYDIAVTALMLRQSGDEFSRLLKIAAVYMDFCASTLAQMHIGDESFSASESAYTGKKLLDNFRAEHEVRHAKILSSLSEANQRLLRNQRRSIYVELLVCGVMLITVCVTGFLAWEAKSARKRQTDSLRRSRDYAESIINTVHEPLLVLDEKLRVTTANKAFYLHFRTTPSKVIDKPITSLPETSWFNETIQAGMADVLANATTFSTLIEHDTSFSEKRKLQVDIRKIYRPGNHTTSVLCLLNDITEHAHMEAALREVNTQLTSFAYSVAHDLRAPLRAMQGFSQALVEDFGHLLPKEGKDYTDRIIAASSRMDRLIRDLLDYSRLSRDEVELAPVNLTDLFLDIKTQCLRECETADAEIRLPESLPTVIGARSILQQIFINLISNALKFIPKGSIPVVTIKAEKNSTTVRIWVEDNGIGIPPAHLERIFGVFERLHGIDQYPGTGIGLAIVRKGAERLGGKAGALSELGQGSRFWVELPAAPTTDVTPPAN